MTSADTIHIVSTTEGHVWLLHADDPENAEQQVQQEYDPGADWVYYEGELESSLSEVDRDGVALLNS